MSTGAGDLTERFVAAFSDADFVAMRDLLAEDLVAWVTDAEGGMDEIRVGEGRIKEWRMVDAKPAESDEFWS